MISCRFLQGLLDANLFEMADRTKARTKAG